MTHTDFGRTHSGDHIGTLSGALVERIARFRRRRRFNRLLDLDDQMLKDIGVTRGEVEIASAMPLSADAATALRRMSLERRRSHM
ncbi:MAG: DUF1127 domain-containing protein [Pseudomonadota bacterium]